MTAIVASRQSHGCRRRNSPASRNAGAVARHFCRKRPDVAVKPVPRTILMISSTRPRPSSVSSALSNAKVPSPVIESVREAGGALGGGGGGAGGGASALTGGGAGGAGGAGFGGSAARSAPRRRHAADGRGWRRNRSSRPAGATDRGSARTAGESPGAAEGRSRSALGARRRRALRQYGGLTTTNCAPCGAYQVLPHC